MLFSQRKGIKPGKSVIQIESMNDDLRNCLWNALTLCYWNNVKDNSIAYFPLMKRLIGKLWLNHFKLPLDDLSPSWNDTCENIKNKFYCYKWYEVYDFIEFVVENYPYERANQEFINYCNSFLERELSAYRFVGGKITQITSQEEISTIEEALNVPNPYKTVNIHIKTALTLFSDKKSPDYRNSIKESISAVELICKLITKKKNPTLSQALNILKKEIRLHSALEKAFDSLYGYASDEEGIRHSLLKETELYSEDAKFMLISCSAFVNYLVSKISKTEIKI